MSSPYDRRYRKERGVILAADPTCWRCGRPLDATNATTDHVPALARHDHVRGSGCCVLMPACKRCNYRDGGRIGGKRVQAKKRARAGAWPARADQPW